MTQAYSQWQRKEPPEKGGRFSLLLFDDIVQDDGGDCNEA